MSANKKKKESVKSPDYWAVLTTTIEDEPYLLRFNSGLWKVIETPKYCFQVGIATKVLNPSNGFPDSNEEQQLLVIENLVSYNLEAEKLCFFAGVITGGGIKEFVLYTSDPELVLEKFKKIKDQTKDYDLQINIQEDKNWDVFKTFCPKPSES